MPSGSSVEKEQLVCEVETNKAVVEIYAREAGVIQYTVEAGGEVPVGSIICKIIPDGKEATHSAPVVAQAAARERSLVRDTDATPELLPARLTPLARSVATEYGIASEAFPPGTLIRKNDVLRMAGKLPPEVTYCSEVYASRGHGENERSASENVPAHGVQVDWQDLPRRKVVEGRILAIGQTRCIQSSVTYSCRVRSLRSRLETIEQSAVGVSALVLFEAARVLKTFPAFSPLHDRGRVGHYREVNIGWAIDGGQGLVVPVVLRADQKTFREIVVTMEGHLESYFNSTLAPGDFLGGTFTLSDLSSSGASFFQPLITQGQSAILGIGSRGKGDRGELLYLTLAFDHQVAEGRMAAQFLRWRVQTSQIPLRRDIANWMGMPNPIDPGFAPSTDNPADRLPWNALHQTIPTLPGVSLVDLRPELCPETTRCEYRSSEKLLYTDNNHLTMDGARYALRAFRLPP